MDKLVKWLACKPVGACRLLITIGLECGQNVDRCGQLGSSEAVHTLSTKLCTLVGGCFGWVLLVGEQEAGGLRFTLRPDRQSRRVEPVEDHLVPQVELEFRHYVAGDADHC